MSVSMADEINVSKAEAEAELDSLEKIHRLLANVYYHNCALPDLDTLLKVINNCFPRKNYKGVLSLVHIFVMLVRETSQFKKTANTSETFVSKTLTLTFGPGDEFQNHSCPMQAFVTFVIEKNELLTHQTVVHLTDYLHGVILYNDIRTKRVESVHDKLLEVDEYFFDVSHAGHGRLLSYLRSSCVNCMKEDLFVAKVYDSFATMERKKMLGREKTDKTDEDNIRNHYAEVLLIESAAAVDVDDDDDVIDNNNDNNDADVVVFVNSNNNNDDDVVVSDKNDDDAKVSSSAFEGSTIIYGIHHEDFDKQTISPSALKDALFNLPCAKNFESHTCDNDE